MYNDIETVLFDEKQLKEKVAALGAQITADYKDRPRDLVIIGILKGAAVFITDLVRAVNLPIELDFLRVKSYGSGSETSGRVVIVKDIETDIKDRDVLIVEDIIDSGVTMKNLLVHLKGREPASLKLCSLLSKPSRRRTEIDIDYLGWEVPDEFIVGYGLDFAEHYRNLPIIGILKREVYSK